MRLDKLPDVKTNTTYFKLVGGIDLVSPPLGIEPGKCISMMNYECNTLGGYSRVDGYERFDGRKSPSEMDYFYCLCGDLEAISDEDHPTVTGSISSATGVIVSITGNEMILTNVTGTFGKEEFKIGGVKKGVFLSVPLKNGHTTGIGHATARYLTASYYRLSISPVPGNGVIRGICMLKGVTYAFRNSEAGTGVDIYRSTPTGWVKITLYKSIPYANGTMDLIDGVNLTQQVTGATAVLKRQVIETEFSQLDLEATSLTPVTMATGNKSFNVGKGKAYANGQTVIATSVVNALNYMTGTIVSYDASTGNLIIGVTAMVGSGSYSNWSIHAESQNVRNYTGRLILANVTGNWSSNPSYKILAGTAEFATPAGELTQISIVPGGSYEFVLSNFLASADTKKIYGTDSLNSAFEFDGDVYIPIRTQIPVDAPTHIAVINDQLCLSFFGQILFSAVGNPFNFQTTSLGFADLGVGDTITGMSPQVGGVLAIFCRDSCFQVALDAQANAYAAKLISPDIGAIHYGLMNLGGLYSFDDKGIVKIIPAYVFGGFEHDTISRAIQPIIEWFKRKIVSSAVFKSKNQVRFYAADGSGICMTMVKGINGAIEHHFSQFKYPISISYAWNGEDASGRDVVFIGDNNGYVYVDGIGSSFDGEEISAYIRTAFNHLKTPSAIKRFRKIEVEMSAAGYCELRFNPDFSYADPSVSTHRVSDQKIQGAGGYWDESVYNTFYYDGKIVSQPELRISGSGLNIGLVAFSQSKIDFGHTLSGITLHYTPRKLNR